MTQTARIVILGGTALFTTGTIAWILTGNWQWFTGGLAILVGTILAGGILSVEVKNGGGDRQRSRRQDNYEPPLPSTVDWKKQPEERPEGKPSTPTAPIPYNDPFTS